MRTPLTLLVLLASPLLAAQTVWKWVDDQGVTHYSDRPVPGAAQMELNVPAGADTSMAPPPAASARTSASTPSQQTPPADYYRDFDIWRPSAEETLSNTGGQVTVSVRIDPALAPGHSIFLYLDGRVQEGFQGNAQEFQLTDVPRGEHTVVAVIVDARGQRIRETDPVRFYVRQTSIAQPPVGPAL